MKHSRGVVENSPGAYEAWLPSLALVVHVVEELPRFPAWATLRFGTTTPAWFAVSHLPIFVAAFIISWHASRTPTSAAVWWLLVLQTALFANGLFHMTASVVYEEYSPGVVSAVLIYTPLAVWLIPRLMRGVGAPGVWAVLTGCGLAALATGSLWLDIPWGA